MGVVVSSPVKTSAFFLTTGIIGVVSFVFTLGTFLKVVWVNLDTLSEAPHEVHAYLTNLRTELLEERASLRQMRKGMKKYRRMSWKESGGTVVGMELDEVTLKTMSDSIRHLIKKFKDLERPFLEPGELGIGDAINHRKRRRNSSVSPPHYDHAAYSSPPDKNSRSRARSRARSNHDRDKDEKAEDDVDEDAFWAQRTNYANFTLHKRWIWLYKKSEAQRMTDALSRVQIRRIARQVGGSVSPNQTSPMHMMLASHTSGSHANAETSMAVLMHEYGCGTLELNEAVRRIDERVSRVVGVRRVD